MTKYDFEDKEAFKVVGVGVELTSDYMDQAGLDKEKEEFFTRVMADGTVDKLRGIAKNDFVFVVNQATDDKMMHYVGVLSDKKLPGTSESIQFPAGKYIAVPGEADSAYALAHQLTQMTFGDVLIEEKKYGYVGGPNTAVIMGEADGTYVGEMWVPVIEQ